MNLATFAARNALRNKLRTVLTALAVAVAVLAFILLRTVVGAWTAAADYAAKDRIGTRHKVTFINPLPLRYVEEIRQVPGVVKATGMSWFGGKHPTREDEFFATIAVDPPSFLEVYDEIAAPREQLDAFLQNRRGALVGSSLAKNFGWKVGDKIKLTGTIYPGDWDFEVAGIYTATRKSIDNSTLWFHWAYLNESVPQRMRDQVGWIASRIDDPSRTADISKVIDERFAGRDAQTLSMSERALNNSFLGMISAVMSAIDLVSVVILLIMVLILGNTIAMGVRERTSEYGALRAIGFAPRHLALFIFGEALTIGVLGATLGLALAYPFVEQGLGRWLEENMGGIFPYFRVETATAVQAIVLSLALGVLAAAVPAWQAARLKVVDSLRRIA